MQKPHSRRTALAMLGLAPATAVGAETFMNPPDNPGDIQSVSGAYTAERFANALEQLAKEIRRGAVYVESLNLNASLHFNGIADRHELLLKFLFKPEV